MKLQKRLNNKTKYGTYYKYQLIIPPKIIEKLGWNKGDELKSLVNKDQMTLMKEQS